MESFSKDFISEHVYAIKTLGYSVVNNYLSKEQCDRLKKLLEECIENYQPVDDVERSQLDRYHMHDLLCKDLEFAKTLEDSRLQELIAPLLGSNWIMYAYTSSSLPPNGGNNYGSRIHVDSPRFIMDYPTNIGVIWALDEFNKENGATYILPGSHNSAEVPTESFFQNHHTRLTCPPGSLILFNARLWHAAGTNSTNEFRHALTMNVCRPYMKQRMDWVRFIPSEIANKLNDQARRIIGYDTRLPKNLEEFFRPEEDRLYKSNQE